MAEFGPEWAVMAEEIAKHAFALQAGMNRGNNQGFVPRGDVFSNPLPAKQDGDDGFGEIEDAD